MDLRFPDPLRHGDRIGVTSPSAGVGPRGRARIDHAIQTLRDRGFDVVVGECMSADQWVSAPKAQRAAELTAMLVDPSIRAVIPPWGGAGTGLDILDQLDYDAIATAEPTWAVGYSDSTAWMTPLTLLTGLATLHGDNLADTPIAPVQGLTHWTDFATATDPVTQHDSRTVARYPSLDDSSASEWPVERPGAWELIGPGTLDVTGTLIGGCLEIMGAIAGTPYGDVRAFGAEHGPLVVYLEAADENAYNICRYLHTMRYAGWFDHAAAVLVGRTNAPDGNPDSEDPGLTQRGAVLDALGDLNVPLVLDLEIGHVPPHLPLLNGATARVVVNDDEHSITQHWR